MVLGKVQRLFLSISVSSLLISGMAWIYLDFFGQQATDYGQMPHPWQVPILIFHGSLAMLFVLVLGSLFPLHIKRGWRKKQNLILGFSLILLNASLIVTALGLYYLGDELWREIAHWTHIVAGIVMPFFILLHIFWKRFQASTVLTNHPIQVNN